jgi:hypothetical protein
MMMYDYDSQANLHCPRTRSETQTSRAMCWTQRSRSDTRGYRSDTRKHRPNSTNADGTRFNFTQRENSNSSRCRKSISSILKTNRRSSSWSDPSSSRESCALKWLFNNGLLRHLRTGQTLRHKGSRCESSHRIFCNQPHHIYQFIHTTRSNLGIPNQRTQLCVYAKRRVPPDNSFRFTYEHRLRPCTTATKYVPICKTIGIDSQITCLRCTPHCHSAYHRPSCQRLRRNSRILDKRQRPNGSGSSNGFDRHLGVTKQHRTMQSTCKPCTLGQRFIQSTGANHDLR